MESGPFLFRITCWFFREVVYRIAGGIRAINMRNMPKEGPVIMAPIHFSNYDPPLVVIAQRRHVRMMAKEELARTPVVGAFIKAMDGFFVKRGEGDMEAIRKAIAFLESGQCVVMFPEGTRGDGKSMGPLSKGVAMLAKKTGAKVVPVGLHGPQIAWPRGSFIKRRHLMTVIYGEPFTFDEVAGEGSNAEQREQFLKVLEQKIVDLCREAGASIEPYQPDAG